MLFLLWGFSLFFFLSSLPPFSLFLAAARINGHKNPSFRAQRRATTELSSRPAFGHVARFNWRVRIEWTRGALWFAERGRFHAAWMKSPHQIPRLAEWETTGHAALSDWQKSCVVLWWRAPVWSDSTRPIWTVEAAIEQLTWRVSCWFYSREGFLFWG